MSQPKLATARSGWGGRGYRIPCRDRVLPSVTTVLKQVAKGAIDQWIADQTAAAAVVNLPWLQTQDEDVAWRKLRFVWSKKPDLEDPVREHWKGVRDNAAELGTNIHEWIEAHLDGIMEYPELRSREVVEMIDAFVAWLEDHDVRPHHAEFTVVNDEVGYAGTADADWDICCLHPGQPCLGQKPGEFIRALIDLKSSRFTWREHGMQLAMLGDAKILMREVLPGTEGATKHVATVKGVKEISWWKEEPAPEFSCYALLHIRPTDLDAQGNIIPAFCVLKDLTAKIPIYRKGYLGAYALAESEFEEKQYDKQHGVIAEETEE